jgi:hypothetical protein
MRGFQGSFPRLKDTIMFRRNGRERQLFLVLIPMLYNFRSRYVGLNQIQWGREKTKPKARPLNLAERTTVGKQER